MSLLFFPGYKGHGELSPTVRDQAKKGKNVTWTWKYARDFTYSGSYSHYKLIKPEIAPPSYR